MSDVKALGYVCLRGPLGEWHQLAEILGLQVAPGGSDSAMRFRLDERAWRIAVDAGEPGCSCIGWEVGSRAALNRLREKLVAAKIPAKYDPKLAAARGVAELFTCQDPSGICLEFFHGPELSTQPFVSPTGARFITSHDGATLGLGHVVLLVDDEKATDDFYLGLLGFELSDSFKTGSFGSTFAHINARHHSLAFGQTWGKLPSGIHHIMLEVDSLDVVGRASDRVTEAGVPINLSLGKHVNDLMTSFYLSTPSGCDLEYGFGGRLLDASWTPTWFNHPSLWGHKHRVPIGEGPPEPKTTDRYSL
jgi:3,4-dihydroxy-9,10-secoandrosta-1,3,5(10)-triene-9,17-dione 4,5-dioxygenase